MATTWLTAACAVRINNAGIVRDALLVKVKDGQPPRRASQP